MTTNRTASVIPLPQNIARILTLLGGLTAGGSALLSWTWTSAFPGDLTYYGSPAGLQWLALVGGALTVLLALAGTRGLRWLNPSGSHNSVLLAAIGTAATIWYALISIALELGGFANLEPGGWVAGLGSLLAVAGALALPLDLKPDHADNLLGRLRAVRLGKSDRLLDRPVELSSWLEILIIIGVFAAGLVVVTFGITTQYGELFIGYLLLVCFGAGALGAAGLTTRLRALTTKHRSVTTGAAFAAAAAFPFTQSSDQYTLIGVNILIFATVALGLNVVVGLAGLLDLGYVAFLGVGAYAAALVSGSPYSVFRGFQVPFPIAALIGAAAALVFGVLIGAPTLRLRGDYLAIVTLGFGEIFRLTMLNLDGTSGPSLTNGPNGIASIPDVQMLGFNFGQTHQILGFTLGKFANYLLLMLVVTAIVVTVFSRVSSSRIGRAWIAIREDETAAEAMGINGFRVKLIAFALGATLAGLAGAVEAHVQGAVTPEGYVFAGVTPPNSAFLLAAVILGGMGTISGPLVGAALLFLIPAKLQFLHDYQLLGFGLALILLMRFRPEGIIPNRRQQLEYHEDAVIPAQGSGSEDELTKAGA